MDDYYYNKLIAKYLDVLKKTLGKQINEVSGEVGIDTRELYTIRRNGKKATEAQFNKFVEKYPDYKEAATGENSLKREIEEVIAWTRGNQDEINTLKDYSSLLKDNLENEKEVKRKMELYISLLENELTEEQILEAKMELEKKWSNKKGANM